MRIQRFLLLGLLFCLPFSAIAHGAHGTGLVAGFTHPVFGIDHLVAILGLGFVSYRLLPIRQWLPSLVFVAAMVAGGLLGINAEAFRITEIIIVLSVIILGSIMVLELSLPVWAFVGLAAIFGFFHGHAHGVEMPKASNVPLYLLGFTLGATLLSIIGMLLARWLNNPTQARLVGAFIAGMGLMMFMG